MAKHSLSRLFTGAIAGTLLTPIAALALDYGDAPSPYPTLAADQGPSHASTGPRLGQRGSDDGATFETLQAGQLAVAINLDVVNADSGAGLDMWIDWNGDGSWGGPNEHIAKNVRVSTGQISLSTDVPSWARPGDTYARIRISSTGDHGIIGDANDGEVEDYQVTITPADAGLLEFREMQTIANDSPVTRAQPTVADLDQDGDNDVIYIEDYDVKWAENLGHSDFATHTIGDDNLAFGFQPSVADLDEDGDLDVIGTGFSHPLALYNDGEQNFNDDQDNIVSANAYDVVHPAHAIDFDSDGSTDVASYGFIAWTTGGSDETIARLEILSHLQSNNRSYARVLNAVAHADTHNNQLDYSNMTYGLTMVPVDVDGDGDLDFITEFGPELLWVETEPSNCDGPCWTDTTQVHVINNDVHPTKIVSADVTQDGDMDIIVASETRLDYYENDGNGNFTQGILFDPQHTVSVVADVFVADMDGDGALDIISAHEDSGEIRIFINQRETWAAQGKDDTAFWRTETIKADNFSPRGIYAADMDNDGDLDIVAQSEDQLAWFQHYKNNNEKNEVAELLADYSNYWYSYGAQIFGGPGGSSFSDIDVLKNELANTGIPAYVSKVIIRTGSRVDRVKLVYNNGEKVTHGSSGGSIQSKDLSRFNQIKGVHLCQDYTEKYDKNTIHFIRLTFDDGDTLEGGTKQGVCTNLYSYKGYPIKGFRGNSGTEVDRLGIIIEQAY